MSVTKIIRWVFHWSLWVSQVTCTFLGVFVSCSWRYWPQIMACWVFHLSKSKMKYFFMQRTHLVLCLFWWSLICVRWQRFSLAHVRKHFQRRSLVRPKWEDQHLWTCLRGQLGPGVKGGTQYIIPLILAEIGLIHLIMRHYLPRPCSSVGPASSMQLCWLTWVRIPVAA